jgi:SOS-response transcriptional repressor LexA
MADPKEIGERLAFLRKIAPKLSQAEAADIVGVSVRTWGSFERGEATPKHEQLKKFAISRGMKVLDILTPRSAQNKKEIEREIPIIDRIPAGPLTQGFGEGGIIGYFRSTIKDIDAFGLLVTGFSMSPEIQEDDIVTCSPMEPFVNGKIYATVVGDGEQSLKRVRRDERAKAYSLIPSNKEFPTIYVPEEQIIKLIRVVEVRRDLQ